MVPPANKSKDRKTLTSLHGLDHRGSMGPPSKASALTGKAIIVPPVGQLYQPGVDNISHGETTGASGFYGKGSNSRYKSSTRGSGAFRLPTTYSATSQYRDASGSRNQGASMKPRGSKTQPMKASSSNIRQAPRKSFPSDNIDSDEADPDESRDPIDLLGQPSKKNPFQAVSSKPSMAKAKASQPVESALKKVYVGGHLLKSKNGLSARFDQKTLLIISGPNEVLANFEPNGVLHLEPKEGSKEAADLSKIAPCYDECSSDTKPREVLLLLERHSTSDRDMGYAIAGVIKKWESTLAFNKPDTIINAHLDGHVDLGHAPIDLSAQSAHGNTGQKAAVKVGTKGIAKTRATRSAQPWTLDDDEDEEPVRRIGRTRASESSNVSTRRIGTRQSQNAAAAEQTKLFSFPFSGPGAVSIYPSDLQKLDDEEFLNDTIIEFALKLQLQQIADRDPELAGSIHIFSSFFYKTLSEGRNPGGRGYNHEAGFKLVQNWTSKVDLFKKKYIVIPINEHLHWYLAIIINPSYLVDPPTPPIAATTESGDGDVQMADAEETHPAAVSLSEDSAGVEQTVTELMSDAVSDELQDAMEVDEATHAEDHHLGDIDTESLAKVLPSTFAGVTATPPRSKAEELVESTWRRRSRSSADSQQTPHNKSKSGAVSLVVNVPETNSKRARQDSANIGLGEPSSKRSPYFADSSPRARGASVSPWGIAVAEEGGNAGQGELVGGGKSPSQRSQSSQLDVYQEFPRKSGRLSGVAPALDNFQSNEPLPRKKSSKKRKGRIDLAVEGQTKTMIVVMDSLQQAHRDVHNRLGEYLRNEYRHKRKLEEFDFPGSTRGLDATAPRQPNFCDCGLYLIHFFTRFFSAPDKFEEVLFTTQSASDPLWQGSHVSGMRAEWREIIKKYTAIWAAKQKEEKEKKEAEKATRAAAASDAPESTVPIGASPDPAEKTSDDSDELTPLKSSKKRSKAATKGKGRGSGATSTEAIVLDSDSD